MSKEFGDIGQITKQQVENFRASNLFERLPTFDVLQGAVEVVEVESSELYMSFSAKVSDNPDKDTLTVVVDTPTIEGLAEEFSRPHGLAKEDISRMYVGLGIANLLVTGNFSGQGRLTSIKKLTKFADALCEPQGFYAGTMESPIFDDSQADETAREIAADGHSKTAKVNAIRLTAGMFVQAQPDAKTLAEKVQNSFRDELHQVFNGKQLYISTMGFFKVKEDDARDSFTDSIEELLGYSFPMHTEEIKKLLKILS